MALVTGQDMEREIVGIAAVVLSPDSMPRKLIEADKPNDSDIWDEKGDRERSDANIGSFFDNWEEGIKSLTTRPE